MVSLEKSYLIDFESICMAPREYELGMLLAINLINLNNVADIIQYYNDCHFIDANIDVDLVMRYRDISLFINGLWYLGKNVETDGNLWKKNAEQQLVPLVKQKILPQDLIL